MNRIYLAVVGVLLFVCASNLQAALDRIGDFALLDSTGKFHQLSRYQHRRAVVLMSYVDDCAAMDFMLAQYKTIRSKYSEEDVEFLLIDSLDLGRPELTKLQPGLPLLEDDGQLVSEILSIEHAGDVLVLNPRRLSVYYQGPVASTLDDALAAVLNNSLNDTVKLDSSGCAIDYPVRDEHADTVPDYSTEIAPIIIDNCAECHRQGGVGPFALDSYIMVLGWSPMIREVLLNKRMPPAQVDPYIGHSDSARYLSKQNLQTLVHWIGAGAPRGSGESDPLETLEFEDSSLWLLGEPDYIVTGPENEIPPTGIMDYIYVAVDLPFDEDKWVRAIQYQPGDQSVLHHLMTYVTAPEEDFWGPEREQESVTRRFVEGYAPGNPEAIEFAEGTGVLIPQGYKLSMQFHYVTNGLATVDTTRLGLYFGDGDFMQEKLTQAISTRFVLPANEYNHVMHAEHVFEQDVLITGVRARMNARGKKMKFAVELADGTVKDFFSVPAYNYGWQPHYILDQPQLIPAGSMVHVIGAFDNSISNPTNPDPNKEVTFGLESWDEMFTGYFTYHVVPD
ncbi:MAG: hypothetical protein IIC60_08285 [Proteobacteria bacterium]|nr:hypothetical protein [Pseudomonadota bacterium]